MLLLLNMLPRASRTAVETEACLGNLSHHQSFLFAGRQKWQGSVKGACQRVRWGQEETGHHQTMETKWWGSGWYQRCNSLTQTNTCYCDFRSFNYLWFDKRSSITQNSIWYFNLQGAWLCWDFWSEFSERWILLSQGGRGVKFRLLMPVATRGEYSQSNIWKHFYQDNC